ncbi:MAG TPA: type II secretion system F family protein [Symbiobacteriaceae bacterium]|nr:type II secretion system F family protein [Symbiobacteriaceae bacterium]
MWALIFVLIAMAIGLIMSLMERKAQESVEQRLKRLVQKRKDLEAFVTKDLPGQPLDPDPEGEAKQQKKNVARDALVGMVEKATTGRNFSNKLGVRLLRADWKLRPAEFLVMQGLAAGTGLGVALILSKGMWWFFMLAGWLAPHFLLARSEKNRLKTFNLQLPDALSIIANALRSGYSFLQAMDVVSREMPDPIAKEFSLVLRETRVNIPVEEALFNLVGRIKSADLDLMVTAVSIQRQVGGNLAEVLDKISGTIKDRIRLQGEIRTLTTQGRFSGWIVSLLPIGLAVMFQVISPGYLTPLVTNPIGWFLVVVGVVMQGIGIFMIRNMVNLEV